MATSEETFTEKKKDPKWMGIIAIVCLLFGLGYDVFNGLTTFDPGIITMLIVDGFLIAGAGAAVRWATISGFRERFTKAWKILFP